MAARQPLVTRSPLLVAAAHFIWSGEPGRLTHGMSTVFLHSPHDYGRDMSRPCICHPMPTPTGRGRWDGNVGAALPWPPATRS